MAKKLLRHKTTTGKIAKLVLEYEEQKEAAKAAWEALDDLEMRIIGLLGENTVTLPDKRVASIVDNFVDPKTGEPRNAAYRPAKIKRLELVISKAPKG